jgi:tetraprenyl-beta-curcumene synthase
LTFADPLPLSASQLRALLSSAVRELRWSMPLVTLETQRWRAHAERMPASPLRAGALSSLATKRGHTDGAALFSYEIIWDYLDTTHEEAATEANGRQLHLALIDALDATRPLADYYRYHPWNDDAGYLQALVQTCRHECDALPSYPRVRGQLVREAQRAQVLALNHLADPHERDTALRLWAAEEFPGETALSWYELSGAASASLVVHALLTLAADPTCTRDDVETVYAAYWPWISLATTMLDSYVDQFEDAELGNHSYIAHYPSRHMAGLRIEEAIVHSAHQARSLPNGHRHCIIVACMIALYLSKDSARTARLRMQTRSLANAGGSLPRLLLPILRLWRMAYSHETA